MLGSPGCPSSPRTKTAAAMSRATANLRHQKEPSLALRTLPPSPKSPGSMARLETARIQNPARALCPQRTRGEATVRPQGRVRRSTAAGPRRKEPNTARSRAPLRARAQKKHTPQANTNRTRPGLARNRWNTSTGPSRTL